MDVGCVSSHNLAVVALEITLLNRIFCWTDSTGAKVKVECKDRTSMKLLYSQEATTDSTGTYKLFVSEDHQDQLCDAMLLSSPQSNCQKLAAGRDRARVILTRYNGIVSDTRYANNMGFEMDQPLAGCTQVLQQYQDFDV